MALGTPLVTMPGDYMRGRIVAGGYKQMELENPPVAVNIQDYIEIVVNLASSLKSRVILKQKIKDAARNSLFDDKEASAEIVEFIQASISEKKNTGGLLPVGWQYSSRRSS